MFEGLVLGGLALRCFGCCWSIAATQPACAVVLLVFLAPKNMSTCYRSDRLAYSL